MADLPILFSGPMVRAILREIEQPGTGKTQTRRALNPQPHNPYTIDGAWYDYDGTSEHPLRSPRISRGNRLYVREAWHGDIAFDNLAPSKLDTDTPIWWTADQTDLGLALKGKRRPGMHMPRWASRITLIVTDVRVQRLQDITVEDVLAEGVPIAPPIHRGRISDDDETIARVAALFDSFHELWDSLNADRGYGWDANPWVVAYTFRPILGNIDQVAA